MRTPFNRSVPIGLAGVMVGVAAINAQVGRLYRRREFKEGAGPDVPPVSP